MKHRLNKIQWNEIKIKLINGDSVYKLSEEYNITPVTIYRKKKIWGEEKLKEIERNKRFNVMNLLRKKK